MTQLANTIELVNPDGHIMGPYHCAPSSIHEISRAYSTDEVRCEVFIEDNCHAVVHLIPRTDADEVHPDHLAGIREVSR